MGEKKLTISQSVAWNSIGNLVFLGAQWLLTVLVTRILGYSDAGIFSLAMSVSNLYLAIANYGMRTYQISDLDNVYSTGNYMLSRLVTMVVAFVLCILFALLNSYESRIFWCVTVYLIFRTSEVLFDVISGVYQRHWRMDLMGKAQCIRSALMMALFPASLLLTKNLLLSIALMAAAMLLSLLLYDIPQLRRLEQVRLFEDGWKVLLLLRECLPLAFYALLSNSIAPIPRLFLEAYLGNEQLGIYASIAMPTLIVQMAAAYVFTPLISVFAERVRQGDMVGLMKVLGRCLTIIGFFSAAALILGKLLGGFGLKLLYGPDIAAYEPLLLPLIVCTILTAVLWLIAGVLTVIRSFKILVIGHMIAVTVSTLGSQLFIPIYGMQGASYALIMALVLGVAVLAMGVIRYLKQESASPD